MPWRPPECPTPGDGVSWSWCWVGVFAFAAKFVRRQASHGDVFGLMVGDAVEGNISPISEVLRNRTRVSNWPIPKRIHYLECDSEPFRRLTLSEYDFDFRTCSAHRCPDPWSYFYVPALERAAPLTSRGSSALASDRIELPHYDPADLY